MPKLDFSKVPVTKDNGDAPEITAEVYDLKPFTDSLAQHDKRIELVCEQAMAVDTIKDDDHAAKIIDLAGNIQRAMNMITDQYKQYAEPHQVYVQGVKKAADFFTKRLEKAYKHVTGRLGIYDHQKRQAAKQAEKAAKEEAAKLKAKLEADAKEKGIPAPKVEIPVTSKKEITRGEKATLITKERWTWEATDEDKVPREYLMLDRKKITAAVRAGKRNPQIPGINIHKVLDPAIRTK